MTETRELDHDRVQRMVSLAKGRDEVWAAIGGFDAMAGWHPLIASVELAEIEGDTYRHLTTADGEKFFERLIEAGPHHLTYEIVDGPLPAADYRATLSCIAKGAGCQVFWSAYFVPTGPNDRVADQIVAKFYEIGLEALGERFG